MDAWKEILAAALATIVVTLIGIGVKALSAWLRAQAMKINNEAMRGAALDAVTAMENAAEAAAKKGAVKPSSETKFDGAAAALTAFAKDKAIPVTDAEIKTLIEGAVGATKVIFNK